jgi:hypothetical protein
VEGNEVVAMTKDSQGTYVVVLARIWHGKILVDHREMAWWLPEVLAAVAAPDHVERDAEHPGRFLHFLRDVGPSRWLLVVVSYEQTPARIISSYPHRKDPPSWSA